MALIVTENNWSNQRQKRRRMLRENAQSSADPGSLDTAASMEKSTVTSQETCTVNSIEISVSEFPETGLTNPGGKSAKEASKTSVVSRTEMSSLELDLPHSCESSGENICMTDKNPGLLVASDKVAPSALIENQILCSENTETNNGDKHVAPDEVSPKILETSQERNSPNVEQITLLSRKHKRNDGGNLEPTESGHHPKKARLGGTEKTHEDTNCAQNLAEKDNLKNAVDLPKSSVSFVDLTTDSPSPPTTEDDLDKKGQETTTPYLFKCNLSLRRNKTYVLFELESLDGDNRELMQQLLQYFRNKLLP